MSSIWRGYCTISGKVMLVCYDVVSAYVNCWSYNEYNMSGQQSPSDRATEHSNLITNTGYIRDVLT